MNPAQIYVQASAAVVALSLVQVKNIPGIIANAAKFGFLDNIRNLATMNKTVALLVKKAQITAFDGEMYKAWRRSGLYDSVRSNADMNYMSNTGLGITNDVIRKGGNASLIFYRAGELTNRRISFIAAHSRLVKGGSTKELSNAQLIDVTREANKTMLELNAANKAWWQGGAGTSAPQRVASLATQFMQVLAKTGELAVKGEARGGFSARQKARIATGQLLLFGGAGVPLINIVAPAMMDWLDIKDEDGSIANGINQGATGVVVREMFASDVDVSNRAALFSSVAETITDIFTGRDPLWMRMLSITGTTGQRVTEVSGEVIDILRGQTFTKLQELSPLLLHDRSGETDMDEPTMLETARDIALSLGKISSTGRNVLKAWMLHKHGKILDRRGRVTMDDSKEGFTSGDKLGVAMGFRLNRETRLDITLQTVKDIDELVQDSAQVIIAAYHRYVYTHDMNPKYAASVSNTAQLIHETVDNPILVERITDKVQRAIFDEPQTREERALKQFYDTLVPELVTEAVMIDTSVNLGNVLNKQAIVKPFQRRLEENK
jgi:hypothetical protein